MAFLVFIPFGLSGREVAELPASPPVHATRPHGRRISCFRTDSLLFQRGLVYDEHQLVGLVGHDVVGASSSGQLLVLQAL